MNDPEITVFQKPLSISEMEDFTEEAGTLADYDLNVGFYLGTTIASTGKYVPIPPEVGSLNVFYA